MNGVNIRVFNSYISDFKQTCCDSQALAAWVYTDSSLTPGTTVIRAAHVAELRAAVAILE